MDLILFQPFLHARGGLEKVVLEIAKRYNPVIYTYRYRPASTFTEFKEFDIRTIKPLLTLPANLLPERVRWAMQSGEVFWNLKIKDDYDVLNAHGTPSEWARNKNPRMLWYNHSPNREAFDLYEWRMRQRNAFGKLLFWSSIQFYRHYEFSVAPKIERIVTNSKNSQLRIKKYLNRDADIIYPGINAKYYANSGYERFFFYPSRITPEKRFEYAIEAFKKSGLHKKGFRIIIAGSLIKERKEHRAYYEKIKKMLAGIGTIRINLSRRDLLDLYSRCYAVLFTPVNEDFGIIPLEAMACEKPVIAVNEGGPRETVVDQKNGYLVNSVYEMAERMKELARNESLAESMGKNGRMHVSRHFTWDSFFANFDKALKSII